KDDLAGRLLPAVEVAWPAAIPVVAGLLDFVGLFEDRIDDSSTLVHNDLHMGNVLCTKGDAGEVRCVGLLDLETAMAAPPEADIAAIQVHHGPLFQQPIE